MKNHIKAENVFVPLWDHYFNENVVTEGTKAVLPEPVPWNSFQYKSFRIIVMKDQEEITILTHAGEIDQNELFQIADIFGIDTFQINRTRRNYVYLSFGPKSPWWIEGSKMYQAEKCKLKYDRYYCKGYTSVDEDSQPNHIFYTVLESQLN